MSRKKSIFMRIGICIICQKEFPTESDRRDVCHKKECRRKRKSQISHKEQRQKSWIKMRSRLNDRHKAILLRAGIPGPYKVGDYLKASTRRIKIHIQNQFNGRWTWDDYGFQKKNEKGEVIKDGFTIDHIIPCIMFDVTRDDHLRVLWSLENLRPEAHLDNLRKHGGLNLELVSPKLMEMCREIGIQLTEKKVKK